MTANDIFKCIFLNKNISISNKIYWKGLLAKSIIDDKSKLT